MKKKLSYICLLLTTLLSSCQDYDDPGTDASSEGGLIISFNMNSGVATNTRTALDPDEVEAGKQNQHVKYVQLYIFHGEGNDALCVASENVKWEEFFTEFGNSLPTVSAEMNYRVEYKEFAEGDTYTFMAVGLDDRAGDTYGLPDALVVGKTTLGKAIGTLSREDESNWQDMRYSELFTGKIAFIPDANIHVIELYRRVAGVIAWLKEVPATINSLSIDKVRISLYATQNKSVPLIARSQKPVFEDYEDSPLNNLTEGYVLMSVPVTPGNTTAFSTTAFMLPMPSPISAGTNAYTLKVELVHQDAQNGAVVVRSFRTKLSNPNDESGSSTGSGTGIIDTESPYRFPIIANHIYQLGTKTTPVDFSGEEVLLQVVPWNEVKHDVEFPVSAKPAYFITKFNQEKYIFNSMSASTMSDESVAAGKAQFPGFRNYDAEAKTITVIPSYGQGAGWSLEIPADCNWLHFKVTESNGNVSYTKVLQGTAKTEVTLFFNDYVEQRTYTDWERDLANDYRQVELTLTTIGGKLAGKVNKLPIKQYNAITIDYLATFSVYKSKETAPFAISRLDVGDYFDWDTGEVVRYKTPVNGSANAVEGLNSIDLYGWGYWTTLYASIYYGVGNASETDGQDNIQRMAKQNSSGWKGSAGYYCSFPTCEIDDAGKELTKGKDSDVRNRTVWYMPAKYQNVNLLRWYNDKVPAAYKKYFNFKKHTNAESAANYVTAYYWSSTTSALSTPFAFFSSYEDPDMLGQKDASVCYSIRPARNLNVK